MEAFCPVSLISRNNNNKNGDNVIYFIIVDKFQVQFQFLKFEKVPLDTRVGLQCWLPLPRRYGLAQSYDTNNDQGWDEHLYFPGVSKTIASSSLVLRKQQKRSCEFH